MANRTSKSLPREITMTQQELESFAMDTPLLFKEWIEKCGWHRRCANRGTDLQKVQWIRWWYAKMLDKERNQKRIFADTIQLKLL